MESENYINKLLKLHDMLVFGHLENIGLLSYADLPNVDKLCKKNPSHSLISLLLSREKF